MLTLAPALSGAVSSLAGAFTLARVGVVAAAVVGFVLGAVVGRARRRIGSRDVRLAVEGATDLARLAAQAPVGIAVLDRDRRHRYVNATLAALSGRPVEAFIGKTIREVVPEAADLVEPAFAKVLETGAAVDVELSASPPGSARELQSAVLSLHPLRDADGAITSVGIVARDITAQRRTGQALSTSEARLRALWDSDILGVIIAQGAGAILDANRAMLDILGARREDLEAGRLRWDLATPEELRARDFAALAEARERGASAPYEKVLLRADGRRVPVLVGHARLDEAGTTFICCVVDLTELKRAQAAAAAQLAITKTITENATAALFMLDKRGYCTFMNPAAEEMTGFSMAEIGDAPLHDKIHHHRPDGRPFPMSECPIDHVEPDAEGRAYKDVFIRKDGEMFPVLCAARPILHEGGPSATVLEVRDVTEQDRIEREREALLESERAARAVAERANHLKDEFVATLSHELRTPLNAIQGWTGLLRQSATPEKVGHGLDVIERNSRMLGALISDLLDVSRIAAGKLRLERSPVPLDKAIESAIESVRTAAEAKGVPIHVRVDPAEVTVLGDLGRLVQVFTNLLSNAVKFTPRGGRVEVELTYEDRSASVTVRDTGEGIPPEHLPHLFDRFRQADSSIARRHGGLGLGLSIVRSLVELHDGAVHAESAGVGRGASFRVVLPVVKEAAKGREPPAARAEVPGSGARLAGVRVLLVEDDPDAREIAQRVLEERGAAVSGAASAPEALAALESAPPDVLVSDLGLPGMDGYDLVRTLRASGKGPAATVPAIALTAFARPEDRARSLDAGFSLHLSKPIDAGALVAAVARLARGARRDAA